MPKRSLGKAYDILAPFYDWAVQILVGDCLKQSQFRSFSIAPTDQKILVVGCGTGKVLVDIAKANPDAEIIACDLSRKMVARASARIKATRLSTRVSIIQTEYLELKESSFRYILLPFVLDCYEPSHSSKIIAHSRRCLAEGGAILYSDFASKSKSPHQSFWQFNARRLLHHLFEGIGASQTAQLYDLNETFKTHGFALREEFFLCRGWVHSQKWVLV